jgi:hypothetical protein
MRKPPTGEPHAGKPPVRFGGRGEPRLFPTPINAVIESTALQKHKHRGVGSPVSGAVVVCGDYSAFGVMVGLFPNSEGSQQDRADKKEHGAHRQDIELQGKVHVSCLLRFMAQV